MAYLKYYIGSLKKTAFLDSVTCVEGVEPEFPAGFVKWYEEGDLGPPLVDEETIRRAESPGVAIAFAPRRMSPRVLAILKEKHGVD